MTVDIRQADEGDINPLYAFYQTIGHKDDGYFETIFEKDCIVLVAEKENQIIAFGILNFEPKYSLYQKLEIPEIQDLNVAPEHRQQGIATALVESFESFALNQEAEYLGISVGLTKEYGPAQRLYFKLGFMPDGNGITCDRAPVDHWQNVTLDDDLCLMMIKEL